MSYSAEDILMYFKFVKLINWLIHFFRKYVLRAYYATGTFPNTGNAEVSETGTNLCQHGAEILNLFLTYDKIYFVLV